MKDWLHEITQMDIEVEENVSLDNLPLVYSDSYKFHRLKVDGHVIQLIEPKVNQFSIDSLKKEVAKIHLILNQEIVVYFLSLSSYQRKVLLKNRIPFILNKNSFYLPMLGLYLSQRNQPIEHKISKHFSPFTQIAFLYVLLHVQESISVTELANLLHVQKMPVSRAFREFELRELFEVRTVGRRKFIAYKEKKSAVIERAMPYLINPIQRTIYLEEETMIPNSKIAGTQALGLLSDLNERKSIRAIDHKQVKKISLNKDDLSSNHLVLTSNILEVWKYDPSLLSENEIVDRISLYLSLKSNNDERISSELTRMWEEFVWSLD